MLRKPLSCTSNPFPVMPAMSAPGRFFGRSQMTQSHMKGLQGWILLIPPPLFQVFLALYLHSAFKHDLYHLLNTCAAPCLALPGVQLLSAAGTCCSSPGLEQQPGEAACMEEMGFISKHVIFSEKGRGNQHHTDGAVPSLSSCL